MPDVLNHMSVTRRNVKKHVLDLARHYKIHDEKADIDYVANKFAELSGNDVYEDVITRLCITLARQSILTKAEALRFVHLHLKNR